MESVSVSAGNLGFVACAPTVIADRHRDAVRGRQEIDPHWGRCFESVLE
jgi:hypothetical protein